nr:interleukin-2 receptor subunit beta [Pelodiscus sinensis]|eukprot:XP_014426943.1 interleukin-2 receptor subunit beta [Pelodiscus sinensis]
MTARLRRPLLRKCGPLLCSAGMKSALPLLLYLWLSIPLDVLLASRTTLGLSNLTCFYDTRATLFCTWAADKSLTETPCRLHAFFHEDIDGNKTRNCELPITTPSRCELAFNENIDVQVFIISDSVYLTVSCQTGENWTTVVQEQEFKPWHNIQLRPPDSLQVVYTSDSSCNITWRVPSSSHYLRNQREFEVRYRHPREPWETAKLLPIKQNQTWVKIENLSPDSKYEATVRVTPKTCGVWSNWSKTLVWRTNRSSVAHGPRLGYAGLSNLTCSYDSRATLFCTWAPDSRFTEAPCRLHAFFHDDIDGNKTRNCELPITTPSRCELAFNENIDVQVFTISDSVYLTVFCQTGENWTTVVQEQKFKLFHNIQLRPPDSLQVVYTSDSSCNITWRVPSSSHYLRNQREFEVRYRHPREPWETAKLLQIKQDQSWVMIENLSPDSKYEATICVKPKTCGVWSNWSKTLAWETNCSDVAHGPTPAYTVLPLGDIQLTMPVLVGTTCTILLLVIIFFIVNSQPMKWLKKVLKIYIPDPDKFFPPLSTVHRGDVQKWFSSPFSTSLFSVSSTSPEISELEIVQKENRESQFLLQKAFLTSSAPTETSRNSLSSCFTNQGYFFFHLPDSYDVEPCQVYFTYEPFTRKASGSDDGDSYGTLSSPDLCMLEDDLPLFSSRFLHCTQGNQGFQNSLFVGETQSATNGLGALPEALSSPNCPSPALELKQDEKVNGNVTVLQVSEFQQEPGTVLSDLPGLHDNDGIQTTEEVGDADPQISPTTTTMASSPFSQPMTLQQGQVDDLHRTASFSQVPNAGAYLSLSELQSQYSHCSIYELPSESCELQAFSGRRDGQTNR